MPENDEDEPESSIFRCENRRNEQNKADAEFIAALRNAAPALIAACAREQAVAAERDELQTAVAQCEAHLDTARNERDAAIRELSEQGRKTGDALAQVDALKVECETLEYKLDKATGPFGEFYKVNFAKIVDRLTASSDDPKLLADLLEERWNWESCCDELRVTLAAQSATIAKLREALVEALAYIEPDACECRGICKDSMYEKPAYECVGGRLTVVSAAIRAALNPTRAG
jgi:hypothetical protein